MTDEKNNNIEVVAVMPDKVKIAIRDIEESPLNNFKIGSYLKVKDHENNELIVMIEDYVIETSDTNDKRYIITASQLGVIKGDTFIRGGDNLVLPPKEVRVVTEGEVQKIYETKITDKNKFCFSKLVQNKKINVNVDGNKFFNKHFAIIGSTGSGKSHAVASIIQQALEEKNTGYEGLNNSHIIIFDIHGEYKKAFPDANHINSEKIKIPYWLFDSDELGDLFIESNEDNSHNQVSQFRYAVTENKKICNSSLPTDRIYFDSPLKFKIDEVIQYIKNMNNEVIGKLEGENVPKKNDETLIHNRLECYFTEDIVFCEQSPAAAKKASSGPFKGDFERFILRLETTRNNPRLNFLFNGVDSVELEDIIKQFLGYTEKKSNVTIFDLSGIPFEVLSITVSLISRLLFEYGYYYKKILSGQDSDCDTPLLLVYEEAHKYVPRSDLVKYRASKNAIERIAKEGRKYGVTLGIVSQRPSEISETIFSQCNNFLAMRLTNPDDQYSVKKLLPDSSGNMIMSLPSLQSGEAILTGDSIIIPSIVKIDECEPKPHSGDVCYLEIWKEQWKDVDFSNIKNNWKK